jgi:lysozyme family protein
VKKNGITVATFSAWGSKVNSTYQGLSKSEASEVSDAIYDFIDNVKESVSVQVIDL